MTLAATYVLLPKKIQQLAGLRLKPNRSPAKRVRFGEEEQQNERALTYKISRSKRPDACSDVEQVRGIEPPCSAWEADILPLNYTCKVSFYTIP